MRVTALLTGRGNNTLKDKNIIPILGKPALAYPAIAAKNSLCFDNYFVSSDCEKILNAAAEYGFVRILRPAELAMPNSQHKDVINHALAELNKINLNPDILVVLLANSPTILPEWIADCVNIMKKDASCSAVVPVKLELDHHPFRAKRVLSDGSIKSFFDFSGKHISSNRQDLPKSLFLCHNFWVLRVSDGLDEINGEAPWNFMGAKVLPYEVNDSFDIHSYEEVEKAERWLLQNASSKLPV